ncbi:MAG: ABC transporter ATP-binding protein [Deltaproteobacteria bacterium]|nr:ABC transporter ATP-binding protein [Deltaproteobacteria bacterium]
MAFLELRGVAKTFAAASGSRTVLKDVSLRVERGEFVTVVGGSGVGKTTLVSLIAGLLPPDAGSILLDGRPIAGPGPDRGIVFQNYSLLPWMTVFGNVYLAVEAVTPGWSARRRRQRTEQFLHLVELGDATWKHPAELSGGMRQRVSVARALAMKPKVLLLDEPFGALDALTRSTLQKEMARIWGEGKTTVLMITNEIDEAILLGDRICALAPNAAGAPATISLDVPVAIPRPRFRRGLSLEPGYQQVRKQLVEFLTHRREPRSASVVRLVRGEAPSAAETARVEKRRASGVA